MIFTVFDKNPLQVLRTHQALWYYRKGTDRIHPTELDAIDVRRNPSLFSAAEKGVPYYEDLLIIGSPSE